MASRRGTFWTGGGRFITTQGTLLIYLSRDGSAGSIDIVIIHDDHT